MSTPSYQIVLTVWPDGHPKPCQYLMSIFALSDLTMTLDLIPANSLIQSRTNNGHYLHPTGTRGPNLSKAECSGRGILTTPKHSSKTEKVYNHFKVSQGHQ